MADFFLLLKVELLSLFGINKALKSKDGKDKKKLLGLLILFAVIGIFAVGCSVGYSLMFADVLSASGESLNKLPAIMFTVACVFSLFTTIQSTNGVLFAFKDYGNLMSLPIKSRIVVLSKVAYIYIVNFLVYALLVLPASIVYSVLDSSLSGWFWLRTLFALPFMPLILMVVGLFLGALIAYIGSRFQKNSLINTILSSLLMILYFVFIFTQNFDDNAMNNVASVFLKIIPLNYLYIGGICDGDLLLYILFVLCSFLIFLVFIYVFGKMFKKFNAAIISKKTTSNYRYSEQKEGKIFPTLFKRDLKRYFSSTIYLMNTIIGAVLMVVFSVVLALKLRGVIANENFVSYLPLIYNVIPLFPLFFIGMCPITACSISIEGNRLWILKSSPCPIKLIYLSKLALNLCFTVSATIITALVFIIALKLSFLTSVLIFALGLSYCVLSAEFGLLINIRFPSFDWKNEMEIVKRGTSVTICVFSGMFFILPVAFVGIVLPLILGSVINFALLSTVILLLLFAIIVILDIVFYRKIMNYGIRRFKQF